VIDGLKSTRGGCIQLSPICELLNVGTTGTGRRGVCRDWRHLRREKLRTLHGLSVWWLRLGVRLERIKPGKPTQNGRHERMHLTLKTETTRPPGMNSLQQQARFDDFVQEFNQERPHEALAMQTPAELYRPTSRPYRGLPEIDYPMHDRDALVTACGRICMLRKKINISTVMAGQRLGLKEVDGGRAHLRRGA